MPRTVFDDGFVFVDGDAEEWEENGFYEFMDKGHTKL